jgi:hypothetical protein
LPSEPITSQTGGAAQSATDKNRTDKFSTPPKTTSAIAMREHADPGRPQGDAIYG